MLDTAKKPEKNDNNRLFGKLVDKMNSGKKTGYKAFDSARKTSVFAENSDSKYYRMEESNKPEGGGVFRQLYQHISAT